MKHPDLRDKQAVMRMEPGWFPYRRKPGKPLASAVRPGNLFCDRTQIGVDVSGHTGHIEDIEKPNRSDEDDKS